MRPLALTLFLVALPQGSAADGLDAAAGKALFERKWIAAPASAGGADGLGPLFNAASCNSCHDDGGGARIFANDGGMIAQGLVVRLGAMDGGPHPRFGEQLQDRSLPGFEPEGQVRPKLAGETLAAEVELPEDALFEFRIAPSLRGKARVAQVPDAAIEALADPDDRDGDGISGRIRRGPEGIGRFGHKAAVATLEEQIAVAAAIDLGLSSARHPAPWGDCTAAQEQCRRVAEQAALSVDLPPEAIASIAAYLTSLNPMTKPEPEDARQLFAASGCAVCHRPEMPDGKGGTLRIYSDLLLHDLGPQSAGAISEDGFSPSEWRTAPLLDLDPGVSGRRYMHDGRAADLTAAIRAHGGEAEAARHKFMALSEPERDRLVAFLAGL